MDGDGAVDRILVARAGLDPQQQRLAGLEHAQGVEAYARLSAMAADEALDAAVRVDQRGGADLDARRPRGAHHDGLDVGDALGLEGRGATHEPFGDHLGSPPLLRCDCNPVSFPPVGTDPVALLSDTGTFSDATVYVKRERIRRAPERGSHPLARNQAGRRGVGGA